jgi:hypothetical protein
VAAVVILGLVIGYVVLNLTRPSSAPGTTQPSAIGSPAASTEPTPSATPSESAAAVLTDASMITPQIASAVDDKRTWKVALTQRGRTADSPQAACLGAEGSEGQPTPQQTVLRLLSSDGKNPPALLHQADAYASPEEAAQAYAVLSKALGGCTMSGAYIASGHTVRGLGDQATGLVVNVREGEAVQNRSVVLTRTGRVVDIVDVAQPGSVVPVERVGQAAAQAVSAQCRDAGGSCAADPQVSDGPPPLGGDEPGFLATGDLPPVGTELTGWVGTAPTQPKADTVQGSGCETTNWEKVEAETRAVRTYLLQDSSSRFGLDEVVVSTAKASDATDLAEKVRDDWASCERRQLTADVPKAHAVSGVGAKEAEVSGWSTRVSQKSGKTTTTYRVGVVAVGTTVIFTFLNPQRGLDLTEEQFDTVTVRAGQRATQVG